MFDLFKKMIKLAIDLNLEENKVTQYKLQFANFIEKHMAETSIMMQGTFLRMLITLKIEQHQDKEVIDLYRKLMKNNPSTFSYQHWRDYCISNEYCKQFKREVADEKMCFKCRKVLNSQFIDLFQKYVDKSKMSKRDKMKLAFKKDFIALKAFIDLNKM